MNIPFPQLEDGLHVAAQLSPGEVPAIAALGFRSLICNRPDGEAEGQPSMAEMAAAAAANGLVMRCIPVVGSAIGDAEIAAQRDALQTLPRPILAYCRSGNRCTVLWALGKAVERPVEELLATASAAGYDLAALRPRLLAAAKPA